MPDATYQLDPVLVGREMHDIEAWLARAGVPARNVPVDAKLVLHDDDTMTIDVYLTRDGRKYAAEDGSGAARGTLTVALVRPPAFESLVAVTWGPE